jgi:hypothetical protein
MEGYLQKKHLIIRKIDPQQMDDEAVATLQQVYDTAIAVAQLARDQLKLEQWQEHNSPMTPLSPGSAGITNVISREQVEELRLHVRKVCNALERKGTSQKNAYRYIFEELYHSYGVTSYELLHQSLFDEINIFLLNWYCSLSQNDSPPE